MDNACVQNQMHRDAFDKELRNLLEKYGFKEDDRYIYTSTALILMHIWNQKRQ